MKKSLIKNQKFEEGEFTFTQEKCTNTNYRAALMSAAESSIKYGVELGVNYIFHTDFYLSVKVFPDEYQVTRCPGSVIRTEEQIFKNQGEFLRCVEKWVDDLWEEITNTTLSISEEKSFEEMLEQFGEMPDVPFSEEDTVSLHQKLDELEALLKGQVEETIKDSKELKKKIAQLESDINFLKKATSGLTQKNWFGSAAAKLSKWRNQTETDSLLEKENIVKKYLLPEKNTSFSVEESKTE